MKYATEDIIQELERIIEVQLLYLDTKVIPLTEEALNWRPERDRWNILEVVEHLNRFGDFYYPKLDNMMSYPKSIKKGDQYKSWALAELIFKRIRPINGVVPFRSKATSKNSPFLRKLDRSVFDVHLNQQKKFINLLRLADTINLSKNGIPTMMISWLKLNYGDSLRILAYHQERHYLQIDNLVHRRAK